MVLNLFAFSNGSNNFCRYVFLLRTTTAKAITTAIITPATTIDKTSMGKPAVFVSPRDACGEFEAETEGKLDVDADSGDEDVTGAELGVNDSEGESENVASGEDVGF